MDKGRDDEGSGGSVLSGQFGPNKVHFTLGPRIFIYIFAFLSFVIFSCIKEVPCNGAQFKAHIQ